MSDEIKWIYNGNTFIVGESLDDSQSQGNSIYPIVWFKGKLYDALIKPKSPPRKDRVCLIDIYNKEKRPYWTTTDKVFNIIKISK